MRPTAWSRCLSTRRPSRPWPVRGLELPHDHREKAGLLLTRLARPAADVASPEAEPDGGTRGLIRTTARLAVYCLPIESRSRVVLILTRVRTARLPSFAPTFGNKGCLRMTRRLCLERVFIVYETNGERSCPLAGRTHGEGHQ